MMIEQKKNIDISEQQSLFLNHCLNNIEFLKKNSFINEMHKKQLIIDEKNYTTFKNNIFFKNLLILVATSIPLIGISEVFKKRSITKKVLFFSILCLLYFINNKYAIPYQIIEQKGLFFKDLFKTINILTYDAKPCSKNCKDQCEQPCSMHCVKNDNEHKNLIHFQNDKNPTGESYPLKFLAGKTIFQNEKNTIEIDQFEIKIQELKEIKHEIINLVEHYEIKDLLLYFVFPERTMKKNNRSK